MFKVGVIGVGKMGSCILNGIVDNHLYNKEEIILSANTRNLYFSNEG